MAITLTNHVLHVHENMGIKRESVIIDPDDTSKPKLPNHYVIVPPVDLQHEDLFVPRGKDGGVVRPSHNRLLASRTREDVWVSHAACLTSKK